MFGLLAPFTALTAAPALGATGDFMIDFLASAPTSYDHLTGGGAVDDQTTNVDTTESLEGGDFQCGDIVTYLVAVTVDNTQSAIDDGPQTIEMDFSFLADTTGQSGVAIGDVVLVEVNYGTIQDLEAGENTVDDWIADDGGSVATLTSESLTGPLFQAGSELLATVELTDLEAGETVSVRIDVKLFCDPGSNPTGNLQADLQDVRLTVVNGNVPVTPPGDVPAGGQTIPFKQIGNIGFPLLDVQKTVTTAGGTCGVDDVETLTITTGDTVKYCYVVYNGEGSTPGTSPLYNVVLVDDNGTGDPGDDFTVTLTSGLTDIDGDGAADDLAGGAVATGEAFVTITSVGTVVNTATVTGDDAIIQPTTLTDTDTATVIAEGVPAIGIVKTADPTSVSVAGTEVTYTYVVTNESTGPIPLTGVVLTDDNATPGDTGDDFNPTLISGDVANLGVLDPGETWTYEATRTITQAEIDAGDDIVNIATVDSNETGPETDDAIVTVAQTPGIELEKSGTFVDENGDGFAQVGETISYSFAVTNTGNVTLTGVDVTDLVGGVSVSGGPIASLAPGATDNSTFTGSYTLTQADIDAGNFFNTAEACGTAPGGEVCDPDDHDEPLPQNAAIELEKSGTFVDENGDGFAQVGETISYSFAVTNTGNVTLTGVDVTDLVGGVSVSGGPIASLAPGATDNSTFTGSYTLTQADIDAGNFVNTAEACGTAPGGEVCDPDDHDEPLPQNAAIELEKSGTFVDENGDGFAQVGETISYSFAVTNTGNVTLTDVDVTDLVGGVSVSGGPIASLAPGATDNSTFTGSYTLTQADIDAGNFVNTAEACGTAPGGEVCDPDDHDEPLPQNAAIELEKSGTFVDENGDGFAQVGETISYSFAVTNTGNVTLTDVDVTDLVGGVSVSGGPIASLAPGATDNSTFTGSYTLTQADIDAGNFVNTAEACGTAPGGEVCDPDDHDEPLPQNPLIELNKTGSLDLGGDGVANPGDLITYTFTVTNTGNVTLSNVDLTDAGLDSIGALSDVAGDGVGVLAPGDAETATGSYAITQADIDSGSYYNLATTSGDCPDGIVDCATDDDPHLEPIIQVVTIDLVKDGSLDLGADGVATPGDLITYTFTVTNTGNVTLSNVTLTDTVGGVTVGSLSDLDGDGVGVLAPGAVETATGSYAITQADIDAGEKYNLATVNGVGPQGQPAEDTDTHTEPLPQNPLIELDKTGSLDLGGDGVATPGDVITYSFVVTNTGNVTLSNVDLVDLGLTSVSALSATTLAPGESATGSGTYVITQADIDAGVYDNTATTSGDCPDGTVDCATDEDPHSEPIPQTPGIDLEKTGTFEDENGDGFADVGETISYSFTVTNTGNVTLTNVTLDDFNVDVAISGGPIGSLAPGASDSTTFTGSYVITQADIDDGNFVNEAQVCADPPIGTAQSVCDEDDHDEPLPQNPLIELDKTGSLDLGGDGVATPGDVITYSFVVTNTGNVTLSNVDLVDLGLTSVSALSATTLAPGESATGSGTYVITQADIDAGVYDNTATTSGDCPDGTVDCATDEDPHSEPIPQTPGIDLEKTGTFEDENGDGFADVGETISYSFTVTNTGNVTLTNVTLDDFNVDVAISGGPIGSLAPGASDSTTFTGSYVITQADIDDGNFVNEAQVCADPPIGTAQSVCDEDDHDEPLPQNPLIELDKTGSLDLGGDGVATPGDVITYSFVVTNTGNVTLSNVDLVDLGLTSVSALSATTLAPGESATGSGTYVITQADIDAGVYDNTATTSGDCPDGTVDCATDEDPHSEPIPQTPGIDLEKTGTFEDENGDGFADVGETISYSFTVTNTGNVTLTNVTLDDFNVDVAISGGPIGSLAPGASDSTTFTGSYVITQADIDDGNFVNEAQVCADPPIGTAQSVCDEDDHDEPLPQNPLIELDKTGSLDLGGDGVATPGDVITYSFVVTNTGNVTLSNVDLVDLGLTSVSALSATTLAPGESATGSGTYVITQADIDAGVYDNTATTSGDCPDGTVDCATDEDPHSEPIPQTPAHELVKDFLTAVEPDQIGEGETGEFELVYTNTGNVTLYDIEITDSVDPRLVVGTITPDAGTCDMDSDQLITCTVDELAPGDDVTITVEFVALGEGLLPDIPGQTSGASYVVYFDNGYVLYGSTYDGTATLLDENRDPVPAEDWDVTGVNQDIFLTVPYGGGDDGGFNLHLSCSEAYIDGWGATGPIEGEDDPDWRVISYTVERFNSQGFLKDCTQTFAFEVPNSASATATPAGGTLSPNPVTASDTLEVVNIAPIEVTRDRVRRGDVEIQYFNTSYEDLAIEIIRVEWTDTSVELESASYQDGVDLGISGCDPSPDGCLLQANIDPPTTIEDRSKDWLKLSFDNEAAPAGLTVTIVTDDGATFTYVYGA